MKLVVYNGSPRGRKGNTRLLLESFLAGFTEDAANTVTVYYLNHVDEQEEFSRAFGEADAVLLAFPLYADSMPGLVKLFIEETLQPFCGRTGNPILGFLVQSGFPEAEHSRPVERYLEKLARRLGCPYAGTMIKGGIEGIQTQPRRWSYKLLGMLRQLGKDFGQSSRFNPATLAELAKPERFSPLALAVFRFLLKLGIPNQYWDEMLKKNDAFAERFARPYRQ